MFTLLRHSEYHFGCLVNSSKCLFSRQAMLTLRPRLLFYPGPSLSLSVKWPIASHGRIMFEASLFQVYLRLRPASQNQTPKLQDADPWLLVEPPSPPTTSSEEVSKASVSTHVILQPPNDSRKRAVEKFGFTKVFQEEATQLDIFDSTGTVQLVKNVLTSERDGLVATLGVTGSGKVYRQHLSMRRALLTESRVTQSSDLARNEASHK